MAASRLTRKALLLEQLFRDMRFCPMCGGELKRLGSLTSEYKTCDANHGTMYVLGQKHNSKRGMFLEIYDEEE